MAQTDFQQFESALIETQAAIDARLETHLPEISGDRLRSAMRYSVLGQGKRLRPYFVLETARLFGVAESRALDVACALECVHCYSLVHDDLPAMDNDDLRRGQPTTHRKFDQATAVLAGDALLTFAFEILATAQEPANIILAFAKASGLEGMVGGQMLDIEAESKGFSSLAEISAMQAKKTGALFEFACIAGPLMARVDFSALKTYASHIGLAFQIADDILDVESTPEALGKATQKDGTKGKATFVGFLGLDGAKREAARLIQQAIAELVPYGKNANGLREAAHFIVSRRK